MEIAAIGKHSVNHELLVHFRQYLVILLMHILEILTMEADHALLRAKLRHCHLNWPFTDHIVTLPFLHYPKSVSIVMVQYYQLLSRRLPIIKILPLISHNVLPLLPRCLRHRQILLMH